MTDPQFAVGPLAQQEPAQALALLRAEGAWRLDPARFHYLEVLARRTQATTGTLRCLLERRLGDAVNDYRARLLAHRETAAAELTRLSRIDPARAVEFQRLHADGAHAEMRRLGARAALTRGLVPLTGLNALLREAAGDQGEHLPEDRIEGEPVADAGTGTGTGTGARAELRSLRRFRRTWARISAEDRVKQAIGRGPGNAGPLNSHMLVLRALALMRGLSPDYLQRFLSQVDTLLWLEGASRRLAPPETRPARRGRQRK